MLLLFETSAGYALFKVKDSANLSRADDLWQSFDSPEKAQKLVKLKAFSPFNDTAEAVAAAAAIVDGDQMDKGLTKFLKKNIVKKGETDDLAVADSKLGNLIKSSLDIQCVNNSQINELFRCVRAQLDSLMDDKVGADDFKAMQLGLSHSLSRYKIKFSADKVDIMIVQAIGLLDDLDKEINTYAMRVKEWYGWHFPEMVKVLNDNVQYSKCILRMGMRTNAKNCDFSDILGDETIETTMKENAEISMGTEISELDLINISALAEQVVSLSEYRIQLYDYLKNRMQAIAPNLTVMVGELVGARLIAHAGSLLNLAKHPASTIQILGAEKALFRALKTKHDTPKYGLIFHASLIGQTQPKHKGKISRVLAAKTALAVRVDALAETSEPTIALESRVKVESRIRQLEGGQRLSMSGGARAASGAQRYDADAARAQAPPRFNTASDVVGISANGQDEEDKKKKKKKAKKEAEADEEPAVEDGEKKKKKKKKDRQEEEEEEEDSKRKRKSADADAEESGEKKKKKKKKSQDA